MAVGYARYWAPVLAPAVAELVDLAAPRLPDCRPDPRRRDRDGSACPPRPVPRFRGRRSSASTPRAGCWRSPEPRPSGDWRHADRARFERVPAPADDLPFADAAFDAALSSFVFQLVPNRARALRETRRVLRPGGLLAYVSWLSDERRFQPDEIFDDLLDEAGDRAGRMRWTAGRPAVCRPRGERGATGGVRARGGARRPHRSPLHGRGLHRVREGLRRADALRRARARCPRTARPSTPSPACRACRPRR